MPADAPNLSPSITAAEATINGTRPAPVQVDPQTICLLFSLPAELRNEVYLLVAEHAGTAILQSGYRDACTSRDALSLTCKLIRYEYLDVLAKKAHTTFSRTTADGFCTTVLLHHHAA